MRRAPSGAPATQAASNSVRVVLDTNVVVSGYSKLARIVPLSTIAPVVAADPADDAVFATALAARAELIVSGDKRARAIKNYQGIAVVDAAEALVSVAP
jgi:predicted nucleic acid-binding protein